MDFMNDLVSRFQSQMTSYDQHLVDKSIEQRILQGLQNVPRKTTRVSNDYLDIDLIRGTPFKKAKPSLNWASFLRKGICRSVFLPYYFRWWKQHTSGRFAWSLVLLYLLILAHVALYVTMADNSQIFTSEVVIPIAVGIFLTVLFTRITSLHSSRKPAAASHLDASQAAVKRARKRGKRKQQKLAASADAASANGELDAHGHSAPSIVVEAESYGSALGWNAVSAVLSPALSEVDGDADADADADGDVDTQNQEADAEVASARQESPARSRDTSDFSSGVRADETAKSSSSRPDARKGRSERSSPSSPVRSIRSASLKESTLPRGVNTSETVTNGVSSQRVANIVSFVGVHSKITSTNSVPGRSSRRQPASSLQKQALVGNLRKLNSSNASMRRAERELVAISSDVTSDPDADADVDADAISAQMRRFLSAKVKNIPDPTPLSCCEDTVDGDNDGDSLCGEKLEVDAGIDSLAEPEGERTHSREQSPHTAGVKAARQHSPATENELALDAESGEHNVEVGDDADMEVAGNGEEEDYDGLGQEDDEYGEAENEDSDDELALEGCSEDMLALRTGQSSRLVLPSIPDGYLMSANAEDGATAAGSSSGPVLVDCSTQDNEVFVRSASRQSHTTNRVHSPTAIRRHNYALQRERTLHLKQVLTKRKQKRLSQLGSGAGNETAEMEQTMPVHADDADADEARRVSGELGGSDTEYSDEHPDSAQVHDDVATANCSNNNNRNSESAVKSNTNGNQRASESPSGIANVKNEEGGEHRDHVVPDEGSAIDDTNAGLRDDSSEYDTMVLNSKRRAGFAALFRERAVKARSNSMAQTSTGLPDCLERSRSPSVHPAPTDGVSTRHADVNSNTRCAVGTAAATGNGSINGASLLRRRNVDAAGLHLAISPDRRTTPTSSHSSLSSSFNAGSSLPSAAANMNGSHEVAAPVVEAPPKPKLGVVRQLSSNSLKLHTATSTIATATMSSCSREVATSSATGSCTGTVTVTGCVAPSLLALVDIDAARDASAESDAERARCAKLPLATAKLDTTSRRDSHSQVSPRSPTHKRVRNSSRSAAGGGSMGVVNSNTAKRTTSTNTTSMHTQARNDGQTSETEWDRLNSDVNGTTDTSTGDESADETNGAMWAARARAAEQEDPFLLWFRESKQGGQLHPSAHTAASDKVSCYIWEAEGDGECKKLDLTLIDVGWSVIQRVEQQRDSPTFLKCAVCVALIVAASPLAFRAYRQRETLSALEPLEAPVSAFLGVAHALFTDAPQGKFVVALGVLLRSLLLIMFFLFFVTAERAFFKRLLYAKHFCYITSARRARKYELPHFRLNKVKNIRIWLSLRSYLRKRGPLRSVDMIISDGFLIEVFLVGIMCFSLLQGSGSFVDDLLNWDATLAAAGIGIFLMRFMTIGLQIDKKFKNLSILITEQMNLYLHMEQKPHKKEELMMANNVLRLAEELIKQLEHPFTISGMALNPVLYNITKIVLLSAFSGALTEILGFKLKLYKIKIGFN